MKNAKAIKPGNVEGFVDVVDFVDVADVFVEVVDVVVVVDAVFVVVSMAVDIVLVLVRAEIMYFCYRKSFIKYF